MIGQRTSEATLPPQVSHVSGEVCSAGAEPSGRADNSKRPADGTELPDPAKSGADNSKRRRACVSAERSRPATKPRPC